MITSMALDPRPIMGQALTTMDRALKSSSDATAPSDIYKSMTSERSYRYRSAEADRRYKCDKCGACFTTTPNLRSHMTVHSELKPCACTLCNYRTKHRQTLRVHNGSCSNQKHRRCGICGTLLKSKAIVQRHMLYVHGVSV
jgi:uncharacterized Zn-finger protein